MKIGAIWRCSGHTYRPSCNFQLSEVEKKPYLDQKTKYIFTLKNPLKKFFNMPLIIKRDFIRWLKHGVRIPKQF